MKFEFERLLDLLGKQASDPLLIDLVDGQPEKIHRIGAQGFLTFKGEGISAVFKDIGECASIQSQKCMLLSGFHFHREGHGGYGQYLGVFPSQVCFNDTEQMVRDKLGQPDSIGGGGISRVLGTPIPYWIRYRYKNGALTMQLDSQRTIEMISLFDPNLHPVALSRQN